MTWIVLLFACGGVPDGQVCEHPVVAHQLTHARCRAKAAPLPAAGRNVERVVEAHDGVDAGNSAP